MRTLGAVLLAAMGSTAHADPLDVYGVWLTAEGESKIEIADCGNGTPCGRIVWVNPEELSAEEVGQKLIDSQNPDEALAGQPIIGLKLLFGFEEGRNRWRRGKIYDAETGDTYRASIARNDDGTLSVKGCVTFICREFDWTRAPLTDEERAEAEVQAGP